MTRGQLYYLTNSFLPKNSGGVYARLLQVEALLNLGYEVTVVTAEEGEPIVSINDYSIQVLRIPRSTSKFNIILQHIGIIPDANYNWARSACQILQSKIQSNDILFAVTGGDLSTFILGSLLKAKTSAKLILSYHDPVTYTDIDGIMINSTPHINRSRFEQRYLNKADLIITSNNTFRFNLIQKYGLHDKKVRQIYFGFRNLNEYEKIDSSQFHIIYAGNFSKIQSPELIIKLLSSSPQIANKIQMTFIGHSDRIQNIKYEGLNIQYINYMDQSECLKYISKYADLALVSLKGNYFSNCFPSKIFDYLSCNVPIIGILPKGNASEFINDNKVGIAENEQNLDKLTIQLANLVQNPHLLKQLKENIITIKSNYNFQSLINNLQQALNSVHNNQ